MIFGDNFKPSKMVNNLETSLEVTDYFDAGGKNEFGEINNYGCLVANHKNEFSKEYCDSEYEQEFVDFFRKNYQSLILNNADDLRIFIEAYYSDQCNFEIFDNESLAELAKYKVSLPISVYYYDND
jgi:hypothetical protein